MIGGAGEDVIVELDGGTVCKMTFVSSQGGYAKHDRFE